MMQSPLERKRNILRSLSQIFIYDSMNKIIKSVCLRYPIQINDVKDH